MSKTEERKEKHLSICTDPDRYDIEGFGAGFEGVHLIHNALPELAEVDTSVTFLDRKIALPLLISCMTGGSEGGDKVNRELARAAQEAGIPVGIGSIRVLFEKPDLHSHFHLKPLAPDVPVLANLGGVQVRDLSHDRIFEWLERLEVQALVVHLNPGQELFQEEGDRDFRGVKSSLARLCSSCPVPVLVKETGFGISPQNIDELFAAGADYVDIAGAGGTNWVSVESYRLPEDVARVAREFDSWGIPTALLLASLGRSKRRIIASGGIRTGVDVAKSIALGAELAAMALPFARAAVSGGREAALGWIARVKRGLKTAMVLTGSQNIPALRKASLWLDPSFSTALASFRESCKAFTRSS